MPEVGWGADAPQSPEWWRASDGRWYPPSSHPGYVQPSPIPPAPVPTATPVQPGPEANPRPAPGEPEAIPTAFPGEVRADRTILVAGGAMTALWVLVVYSILFGNSGMILLWVMLMLPINLYWRFVVHKGHGKSVRVVNKYTRAMGHALERKAAGAVVDQDLLEQRTFVGDDGNVRSLGYSGGQLVGNPAMQSDGSLRRSARREAKKQDLFEQGMNRGCGSMVVGFFYPVKDFFAELKVYREERDASSGGAP